MEEEYSLDALHPPRFILDLGAHVGTAVAFFKLRYPDAVIHAVEPDPDTFARLRANVDQFAGVTLTQAAIAGARGTAFLHTGAGSLASTLRPLATAPRAVAVQTVTIDELLDRLGWDHVDVMKLDIEGAEYEALAACRSLERVRIVIGEMHPHKVDESRFFDLLGGFKVTTRARSDRSHTFVAVRRTADCF